VIVQIRPAVEARGQDGDRAQRRGDDQRASPQGEAAGQHRHRRQHQGQAQGGVQDQPEGSGRDRPGHALDDAAEVLGGMRAGMLGGDLDEVDRHPEQELGGEQHQDHDQALAHLTPKVTTP
jgi:hypothetical protein